MLRTCRHHHARLQRNRLINGRGDEGRQWAGGRRAALCGASGRLGRDRRLLGGLNGLRGAGFGFPAGIQSLEEIRGPGHQGKGDAKTKQDHDRKPNNIQKV